MVPILRQKAKGVSAPHRAADHREEGLDAIGVPTVSLDYFRAAEADDEGHTEHLGKDIAVPIMYVNFIKATFVVPCGPCKRKGVVTWVVNIIVNKLETIGYGGVKIALKSNGELAIKALVNAIAVARQAETAFIQPPKRESNLQRRSGTCSQDMEGAVVDIQMSL